MIEECLNYKKKINRLPCYELGPNVGLVVFEYYMLGRMVDEGAECMLD